MEILAYPVILPPMQPYKTLKSSSLYLSVCAVTLFMACSSENQNGELTSDSDSFQTDSSYWQTVETQNEPTARHENAFAEVDGKFYLIGGRGEKPTDIYDPQTQTWSEGKTPPLEMHHFQAVPYQGKIYIMGAFTGGYPDETPIPNIYIYDPESDQWEKGPVIPEERRRGAAGVVVHNDKFYLVCGIRNGHLGDYKNWLDEYDPSSNEWKVLPDAPHKRDHFQAAIVGDKIYAAGGRTSSAETGQTLELTVSEVDIYDFETSQWTTIEDPIPTQRAGTTAVVLGNDVIVAGGESGTQEEAHREVEALNVNSNEWRALSFLNKGRHGTQAFIFEDKIYIAAGSGNRGGGPELTSMEVFK